MRLRRATWISTLAVAVLAYFAIGVAQVLLRWAIPGAFSGGPHALDLILMFPMVMLIGYVAERFRRRAGIVLGAMLLIAIALMSFGSSVGSPLWYRIGWLVIGPAGAVLGGLLPPLRRGRP